MEIRGQLKAMGFDNNLIRYLLAAEMLAGILGVVF